MGLERWWERLRRLRFRKRSAAFAAAAGLVLVAVAAEGVARAACGRSLWVHLRLPPRLQRIELVGSAASGTVLDGGGGWLYGGRPTEIVIRSRKTAEGWDRPTDVVIRNGRLRGCIRVMGMGRNGQGEEVRLSSQREGHTARAQAAAPSRILISGLGIEACGRIPVYLAPGVTGVTVERCSFDGWSSSAAIYLDAESGRNLIRNNRFAIRTGREVLAVDGSAGNRIEGNRFERLPLGGVYLYRNCGEGGTVRHQSPQNNVIADNWFNAAPLGCRSYAVWLGSRNGHRMYSEADAGYPFGSSADNRDFANRNVVTNNTFAQACARSVRDDGADNCVER